MDSLQFMQSKIYNIRGHRVMLDSDLAELYQVETRSLKEQVRCNIDRFPGDHRRDIRKTFTGRRGRGMFLVHEGLLGGFVHVTGVRIVRPVVFATLD